jgi:hypothetical protein
MVFMKMHAFNMENSGGISRRGAEAQRRGEGENESKPDKKLRGAA